MVDQRILVAVVELAARVDELHQGLNAAGQKIEAANLDAKAAGRKIDSLQSALDDACAQRDEYRKKLTQIEAMNQRDCLVDAGVLVNAASFIEPAKSVHAEISRAIQLLDMPEDDPVALSLSRALAHVESVLDVLRKR